MRLPLAIFAAALLVEAALSAASAAVVPSNASTPATTIDPAALAVARQIVSAVHTEQTMDRMMLQFAPGIGTNVVNAMLADPAAAGAASRLIASGAGGRPKLEAIFSQEFMVAVRKRYPALEEQVAREYASRFSAEELKQILAFYGSGVGAKVLELMPDIQKTMTQAGEALGRDAGREAGEQGFKRAQQEMMGSSPEPRT